jgi:hypothetical protein
MRQPVAEPLSARLLRRARLRSVDSRARGAQWATGRPDSRPPDRGARNDGLREGLRGGQAHTPTTLQRTGRPLSTLQKDRRDFEGPIVAKAARPVPGQRMQWNAHCVPPGRTQTVKPFDGAPRFANAGEPFETTGHPTKGRPCRDMLHIRYPPSVRPQPLGPQLSLELSSGAREYGRFGRHRKGSLPPARRTDRLTSGFPPRCAEFDGVGNVGKLYTSVRDSCCCLLQLRGAVIVSVGRHAVC